MHDNVSSKEIFYLTNSYKYKIIHHEYNGPKLKWGLLGSPGPGKGAKSISGAGIHAYTIVRRYNICYDIQEHDTLEPTTPVSPLAFPRTALPFR